jgi:cytochrome c553
MKRVLKWIGYVVAGFVCVVLLATAWLYFASSREMNHQFGVPNADALSVPRDPAEIAEGGRLAHLAGCIGCHGEKLEGRAVLDLPNIARLVAPNLTTVLPTYDDRELLAVMRHGVRKDGTSFYMMPSPMLRNLSDQDLGRIFAYVRSFPPTEGITEKTQVRLLGRIGIYMGAYKSAARQIEVLPPARTTYVREDPLSFGRYLTMGLCSECHGQRLEGSTETKAPPLIAVAQGYSLEQFRRLMHDGVAVGERETELMSPVARARFSHLIPYEVDSIHEFLGNCARQPEGCWRD